MPTPRGTILAALHARLSALPATAQRAELLPERKARTSRGHLSVARAAIVAVPLLRRMQPLRPNGRLRQRPDRRVVVGDLAEQGRSHGPIGQVDLERALSLETACIVIDAA